MLAILNKEKSKISSPQSNEKYIYLIDIYLPK